MHCLVKAHAGFASVPFSSLALPGAENAGTFNLDPQAFDTQTGSACTSLSAGYSGGAAKAQRFSTTQDQSITTQLDDGVRWIDLQVGYNGGGNPITGWRVVQNLYSSWPLSEYLDQVANWAAQHPTEAVVIDLSTICYDHNPTAAVDQGLWANFSTKSTEGAGSKTIANVAARPSSFGGSLATATLRELTRPGHNVVVLIPDSAKSWQVLPGTYHVEPVRTAAPGHVIRGTTEVVHSDPRVAPTSPTEFPQANIELGSFPTTDNPGLGSLHGKGLYVSKLAYELNGASPATQNKILSAFVGLIASQGIFHAWMWGLWNGTYQQILTRWSTATNVVLADGVELGGFVAPVIERNGR
jgi:hypothetical protein